MTRATTLMAQLQNHEFDTLLADMYGNDDSTIVRQRTRYSNALAKYVDLYGDDEIEIYKVVTTVRSNSLKNLISKESPLGAAIYGHKVGDRCEVKVNDTYSYFVQIKSIENTVDDGSDELRKF